MTDPLVDQLRAADPAADLDTNPHGARAQRLRDRARRAARAPGSPARPRRQLVIAAAVGMLLLGSAAAVASGVFEPDPADVGAILAEAEESGRAAVKNDDWRPTLRAEEVWCVAEDGTVGRGRSYAFALDREMTEADLLDACLHGSDGVRGHDVGAGAYTICEAVPTADHVRRLLGEPRFAARVIAGDVTPDRPGFPIVLGWQTDCAAASVDTNAPPVELRALDSLAAVNRAREVEIGLTAAALNDCLTLDEAETMAHQAARELHGDWSIIEQALDTGGCHRVWLEATDGILRIGPPN